MNNIPSITHESKNWRELAYNLELLAHLSYTMKQREANTRHQTIPLEEADLYKNFSKICDLVSRNINEIFK